MSRTQVQFEVTAIEISARLGGNCIPLIIEHGTGFDEIGLSIELALDGAVPDIWATDYEVTVPTGARILNSRRAGVLRALTPRDEILARYGTRVIELVYDVAVGQKVHAFTQGSHSVGYVIATDSSLEELEVLLDEIESVINLQT